MQLFDESIQKLDARPEDNRPVNQFGPVRGLESGGRGGMPIVRFGTLV
jgi:hypothetical protein